MLDFVLFLVMRFLEMAALVSFFASTSMARAKWSVWVVIRGRKPMSVSWKSYSYHLRPALPYPVHRRRRLEAKSVSKHQHSRSIFNLQSSIQHNPNSPSIFIPAGSGLACRANSSSLAERRSCLAASAGPKMAAALRWLLNFLLLDRELFAIAAVFASASLGVCLLFFCLLLFRRSVRRFCRFVRRLLCFPL